ncbi:MAG: barstar family protein [Parvularculaceae bacterium]
MDIVIAKSSASKAEIIRAVGSALRFPDYARVDNWDSFDECLSDALTASVEPVTIHIRALPTEGSATAELISLLTDLRLGHDNLSFIVGETPRGPTDADDMLKRRQA